MLVHESNTGMGKNILLEVFDKRRRAQLLKKDSERKIKSGRAMVSHDYTPSEELDITFQKAAEEGFKLQGYKVDGNGMGTPREVKIYITKLKLKLRKKNRGEEGRSTVQARLRTKIKLSARNRGIAYTQEYEFFIKKSYLTVPQKIEREKILNYGLTQVLHQILDDPKLTDFLTG
ncbi:MAG: hypothetical protein GWM98_24165 [Nitrospinaceae bacterium]|nr:hypothetical protein [Nitrospinaceae bacterium]NIT84294.1 hypothetical protein [Nitrospinaceae bacterium]NIW61227.1 hypothetical protein [Nitrospinaceae bacterium]NIY17740.1 hypothetical protein [Nitrospinaceae bacterium]